MSTVEHIKYFIFQVLTVLDRRRIIVAQLMTAIAATLEALVIFIFYKFITIYTAADDNKFTDQLGGYISSLKTETAILMMLFLIIFTSIIAIFSIYYIAFVGNQTAVKISQKILRGYLNISFAEFSKTENVNKIKLITAEVDRLALGVIMPAILIFSKVMLASALIVVLGFVNLTYTIVVVSLVLLCYLTFYLSLKNVLSKNGTRLSRIIEARFLGLEKIFYGFEYLAIRKRYRVAERHFENLNSQMSYVRTITVTISQSPKYIMDFIFFASVLALLIAHDRSNFVASGNILDLMAFALAGMKLIPAVQAIFAQLATVKANFPTLREVNETVQKNIEHHSEFTPISLSDELPMGVLIRVEKLSILFPNQRVGLLDASFDIEDKKFVIIRGASGSGKSSFCRALLGLQRARSGKIMANVKHLNNRLPKFSYVPQVIYIFNGSLRDNLCFGKERSISNEELLSALEFADLSDFFLSLPSGFDTMLGDGGASISGGQRQRLGIARAFLEKPDMLILDEPTSALDAESEEKVLKTLYKLSLQFSVLMITHADASQSYSHQLINFDKL